MCKISELDVSLSLSSLDQVSFVSEVLIKESKVLLQTYCHSKLPSYNKLAKLDVLFMHNSSNGKILTHPKIVNMQIYTGLSNFFFSFLLRFKVAKRD